MELQEKIDQYLLDQLSPSEKVKFEELVAADSQLKSEVAMQQSIVTALGNTSAIQMKARLQKIPVSMASTSNAIRLKWMGIAAAGTIAAGLIVFLLSGENTTTKTTSELAEIQNPTTLETTTVEANNEVVTIETSSTDQTVKVKDNQSVEKPKSKIYASPQELKAFDNSASFEDNESEILSTPNSENSSAPTNSLNTEVSNKLSNLTINVDNSNPKDKSYQFSGSKLTLFGDFNDKPYELLELNNKGQKNLFLSYNNEYYELIWGQTKKTNLKKVTHKETLDKLKVINP